MAKILEGELLPAMGRKPKYHKNMCKQVVKLAGEGKTISAFCVYQNISRPTFYTWAKKYPDFANAILIAKEAYKLFWQSRIMEYAFMAPGACNTPLLGRMFDTAFEAGSDEKVVADGKGSSTPININLTLDGMKATHVDAEERRQRIEELKQGLIGDHSNA